MKTDYQAQILSTLLDWYEGSPAYVRGQIPARRRLMRLYDGGDTDFPAYNIENHQARKDINRAVMELAEQGYIGYEWMRGQRDHIIASLWLNAGSIGEAYAKLSRLPKADLADSLLSRLNAILDAATAEWARLWLQDTNAAISRRRGVGAELPDDGAERDDLLKAISILGAGRDADREVETLERVFSIRNFGDSKRFERGVKGRIARIIKKYLAKDDCTDEEALRLVGITQYPEQFAFCGDLSIGLPRGSLDYSLLPYGGTLTIDDVRQGRIIIGRGVKRILSVENLANYVDYVHKSRSDGEFVLYHGGQFSPAKRMFILSIVAAMPEGCEFYHWGDIDYGGFLMLSRLRREIYAGTRPWRMGAEELERHIKYAAGYNASYRKRLISLLDIPELADCRPCIEYMLKHGVRLEQEALLT